MVTKQLNYLRVDPRAVGSKFVLLSDTTILQCLIVIAVTFVINVVAAKDIVEASLICGAGLAAGVFSAWCVGMLRRRVFRLAPHTSLQIVIPFGACCVVLSILTLVPHIPVEYGRDIAGFGLPVGVWVLSIAMWWIWVDRHVVCAAVLPSAGLFAAMAIVFAVTVAFGMLVVVH